MSFIVNAIAWNVAKPPVWMGLFALVSALDMVFLAWRGGRGAVGEA